MSDSTLPIPDLDHAAIGNGRVLALVSPTSAIEWLCLPRFDSPSLFARLLDRDEGGTFRVLHHGAELHGDLRYLINTNVSCIAFDAGEGGAWEVIDFAPRIPDGLDVRAPHELIRLVRPLRGTPLLSIDFDPRPDYARGSVQLVEGLHGLDILGGHGPLFLDSNLAMPWITGKRPFVLDRPIWFILGWGVRPPRRDTAAVLETLHQTSAGWRAWARSCALPSYRPAAVLRSALCLKLHASYDSGAIIAAATTSIPEAMGTERTWDYRYCWLRDAAFVVEALRRLAHVAEGEAYLRFLRNVVEAGPLQPLYGLGGERDLEEVTLDHLAGFGGNGHVRIGNAAALQVQNDLMGELILCIDTLAGDPRVVLEDSSAVWPLVVRLVEEALTVALLPDTGIWEFRSLLRQYTFSLACCWAAAFRGAHIAQRLGHVAEAERWGAAATTLREVFLRRAFNPELGYFTQALDGEHPDASNLLLASLGIIDAKDPRFVATVRAYERLLVDNGMMLRYRNPDDFGETTSGFTICSFWWAEALALMGELDEAQAVFDRIVAFANPLGLFSEDVDPVTGKLLGNFPQSYTHVGLIHAAITIGELLDARDGRVRAWCIDQPTERSFAPDASKQVAGE